MKIQVGLFDHMVLQRNTENVSDAVFAGTSTTTGTLRAQVLRVGKPVAGYEDASLGQAEGGTFTGRLQGLPVGGPYRIELRVVDAAGISLDALTIDDVLVGDVWILGGQSNMQGCGVMEGAESPNPMVRAFYMDDRWDVARDPIHNICDTVDQVHIDLCGGTRPGRDTVRGVGPGVSFGAGMFQMTGIPQGVIACAHGGTSMSQWDPKLKRRGTRSLYGAMVRRFSKNGGKVAGVVWYQGCSDADPVNAPLYTKRMKALVAAMRKDLGNTQLPFVAVQISRVCGQQTYNPNWNSVQEQERRLPEVIRHTAVVSAIDLSLDDGIHISGPDQCRLGRRLAQAMQSLLDSKVTPPIALKRVSLKRNNIAGTADVIVEFDNVIGGLQALGRPSGFELVDDSGAHDDIFRIDLQGNTAILHASITTADATSRKLHYGYGTAPYCNITDAADRAVPVFGPITIGKPRAVTPFVRTLRLSALQPSAEKLHALGFPTDLAALGFETRSFPGWFCEIHQTLASLAPKDVTLFYACRFTCAEPMKLAALLGYDGPLKVWIDGEQVFHDPNGTNPADPSDAKVPFAVSAGSHELVAAIGSNHGNAYGIALRLERLDVTARAFRQGSQVSRMPTIEG